MKGDHLPIIQALKGRQKPKGEAPPQFDIPRTLMVHHSEIPGLPGRKVGEQIAVNIKGHIHSQHNDGHAIVHVASVKPDSPAADKKQYPDESDKQKDSDD